jgi:hypothetical protein
MGSIDENPELKKIPSFFPLAYASFISLLIFKSALT